MGRIKRALVIAPHADDETFGCGGTICKLSEKAEVDLILGTLGYDDESYFRRKEELENAIAILGIDHYEVIRTLQEGRMDMIPQVVFVAPIEDYIKNGNYDAVFIPYPSHHQDHIVINQACMAALRPGTVQPKMILMYEYTYPTWVVPDQYNGRFFVDVTDTMKFKLMALAEYHSQLHEYPHPVSPTSVMIMGMTRGISIGTEYAEMFYVIQMKDLI